MEISCISLILILLTRQCNPENNYTKDNMNLILLELVDELKIRYIIMTSNEKNLNHIEDAKAFSTHFIPIMLGNNKDMEKYVAQETVSNIKTGLVFREDAFKVINELHKLEQIHMLHKASRFTWIIFFDSCPDQETVATYNVPYDCEFITVCPKNTTTSKLLEIFKLKDMTFIHEFGVWNSNSGLTVPTKFFYDRRSNLNSTMLILRSAIIDNMCVNERTCLLVEYLNYIASRLNFRYQLLPGWGILADIDPSQEADFYHNGAPFHADFQPDLKRMIVPFFTINTDWYIKYPKVQQKGDHFQPFHPNLWTAIFVIIITGSSTIIISWYKNKKFGGTPNPCSLVDGTFSAFDCFLSQDGSKNIPFKIPMSMLRFAAIFTMASYSAGITSFLALQIPEIPFRNLDEFLKNGDYVIAKTPGLYSERYFKNRKSQAIQLANENFSRIIKKEDMPDAICEEKIAMLLLDFDIQQFEKKCRLLKVEKSLDLMFFAMILPNNSSFTTICNYLLLAFYTSGILKRHQSRIYADIYEEPTSDQDLYPVELTEVIQHLVIIPVGIICATTFLMCELVYQYNFFLNVK